MYVNKRFLNLKDYFKMKTSALIKSNAFFIKGKTKIYFRQTSIKPHISDSDEVFYRIQHGFGGSV